MAKKINNQVASKTPSTEQPRLPWWVEVLFVQVGLPDKWLRPFLKFKKTSQKNLRQKKKSIFLAFTILFILGYIYPVIKRADISNQCVRDTEKYISDTINDGMKYKFSEISIVALNFCNGGKLE